MRLHHNNHRRSMSTPLRPVALFIPELFLYGYASAYFTGSIWLGPAIALIIWVFFFLSQAPAAVISEILFTTIPVSVVFGTVLGALVIYLLELPPLLPRLATLLVAATRPKREMSTTDNDGELVTMSGWRNHLYLLGMLLVLGTRYALWYRESTTSIFLLLALLGFAITALDGFLLYWSGYRALWLDARYLLYYYFYLLVPWIYSLLINVRPYEGIALLIGLTALTIVIVMLEIFTIGIARHSAAPLEGDPRFLRTERYSVRIAWRWFIGIWLPLLLVYAGAWIADTLTFNADTADGSPSTVLLTVGVIAATMALIVACCAAPRAFASYRGPYRTRSMIAEDALMSAVADQSAMTQQQQQPQQQQQFYNMDVSSRPMTQQMATTQARGGGGKKSLFSLD